MNTLDKKKLELEQDLSIQPDEVEVEEDIDIEDIEDIEKYDSSFFDPSAEEIDIELDIVKMLKHSDEEWSALVK